MKVPCLFLVVVVLLAQHIHAAPKNDLITSLPGLNTTISFKQYAGYVDISDTGGGQSFYWFVEAQSNPSTAPLVLWLQGGPGCSSLLGFFTEHGPFTVERPGPNYKLGLNPYSWNKFANIIYLEAPFGVGFSYPNTSSHYTTGDNATMINNYHFLAKWFTLFPEYVSNDFYVAGESYGGHYVPQLAYSILQFNINQKPTINLKGILVGNPWTDDVIDSAALPPFIYYHHLCSLPTWKLVKKECNIDELDLSQAHVRPLSRSLSGMPSSSLLSSATRVRGETKECDDALKKMYDDIGDDINQYDIYWPCLSGAGLDCSDYSALTAYLNDPTVQAAIHARKPSVPWSVCADISYVQAWKSVIPAYPALMKAGLRVLVYGGDVTYNVPVLGTIVWVEGLGLDVIKDWAPWMLRGQVAGYFKKFNGISFATVKDSGHMVPMYTPEAGLLLFQMYLMDEF